MHRSHTSGSDELVRHSVTSTVAAPPRAISDDSQPQPAADNEVRFGRFAVGFWPFTIALIGGLKLLVLIADSLPGFFLGDSQSYIQTSLTGWPPPDRSFVYGYFIRLVTGWSSSLNSLIVAQVLLGAATALLIVLICRVYFSAGRLVSIAVGVFVSLDPLQLMYERYVLTETASTAVYVVILCCACAYLKNPRFSPLLLLALLSVLLVALRLSFLLVVNISAVLLPLLPLLAWGRFDEGSGSKAQRWRRALSHSALTIAMVLLLQHGYKHLNGYLIGGPPAFQYEDGLFLISAWAPILQPEDAPNAEVAAVIAKGSEFHLRDLTARNAHHYADGMLVSRLGAVVPPEELNRFSKQLAISSALRHPVALASLTFRTLGLYFHPVHLMHNMQWDRGEERKLPPDMAQTLADRFYLAAENIHTAKTLTRRYQERCAYYYRLLVLMPLIAVAAVVLNRRSRTYAVFVALQALLVVGSIGLLSPAPVVRYLHPLTPLLALSLALLFARGMAARRAGTA